MLRRLALLVTAGLVLSACAPPPEIALPGPRGSADAWLANGTAPTPVPHPDEAAASGSNSWPAKITPMGTCS